MELLVLSEQHYKQSRKHPLGGPYYVACDCSFRTQEAETSLCNVRRPLSKNKTKTESQESTIPPGESWNHQAAPAVALRSSLLASSLSTRGHAKHAKLSSFL